MQAATLLREGVAARERPGDPRPSFSWTAGVKPHVCFVAPYAWPVLSRDTRIQVVGGAEVQQCVLARLFQRAGFRVSMICLDFGQPKRTQVDGITVHRIYRPDAGIPVFRYLHPRLSSVWSALGKVDADIYYHRTAGMLTGVISEFCRRRGKRALYAGASDRDFLPGQEQIRFARDRWIYRHGLRTVDAIVAQNPQQVESVRKHFGREAVLIPSCYQISEDARPGSGDTVLWCGTIHRRKRPEMFLDLALRLPKRKFVMIGGPSMDDGGIYFDGIRLAAQALPNVEFTGFLPLAQVEPYFDRAKVFVNTSEVEGMPNTFLQAWARGIPTLGTVDVGARLDGNPVYPVFSEAREAHLELERLLDNEAHWQAASSRVREYFERNHSAGEILARYSAVFADILAGRGGK